MPRYNFFFPWHSLLRFVPFARRRRPRHVSPPFRTTWSTPQEAHALANGNPLSFLHVSRAEIDLPPNTDPYRTPFIGKRGENFAALKTQAPLVDEEAPSLYVYRLQMGTHVQTGIAGMFSIDEYDRGVIKKHEHTRRDKEDDRTRHMIELRRADGTRVPDLPRRGRCRRDRGTRRAGNAALRLHGAPTACSIRSGASTEPT